MPRDAPSFKANSSGYDPGAAGPGDHAALDKLAARCGIASSIRDANGEEHATSSEIKRSLLHAMGFDVPDEQRAAGALQQIEQREWERVLPPVAVAYTSAGLIAVPIQLRQGTREVHWSLQLEDGSQKSGEAKVDDLTLLEQHEHQGEMFERRHLLLPYPLPWGYHKLTLQGLAGETVVIVTPGKCWLPDEEPGTRLWGFSAELFLLRTRNHWGIGDFSDLRALVELTRAQGADVVGLNPLHAMFPDQPEEASPYSPSDRTLLNVLYIDVPAIPEFSHCREAQELVLSEEFQRELELARKASLVQYGRVTALKLKTLKILFRAFAEGNDRRRTGEFDRFVSHGGPALQRACIFQALRTFLTAGDKALTNCAQWPEKYRDAHSPEVKAFARQNADAVRFQLWLQWIADSQLQHAAAAAKGMKIGLYRDVAVGAHVCGAELWSHPEELVSGAHIGAPPDPFGPLGQNWGLPPLHPIAIREHAYASFIALLRANMRCAGGLRLDHAMALQRLYWIPEGNQAKDGAYVHYEMDELIGILALESQRHKCLVVGEDLGTVPEGFRDRMAAANILSYRVLFFERQQNGFLLPEQYPRLGLSVASNHDLPTLKGWWLGSDLDLKDRLGLFPDGPERMRAQRDESRRALIGLFKKQKLLQNDVEVQQPDFIRAAQEFLARTSTLLTLVHLDDLTEEEVQVNVPGTAAEHPNWRRKLSLSLEEISSDPGLRRLTALMTKHRSRPGKGEAA